MISQPVSSCFSVLHCSLGLGKHCACPFPDVVFPPLPLSASSSSPFHCALQDGFSQTWRMGDMTKGHRSWDNFLKQRPMKLRMPTDDVWQSTSVETTWRCCRPSLLASVYPSITQSQQLLHLWWWLILSITKDCISGLTAHNSSVLRTAYVVCAFKNLWQIRYMVCMKRMVKAPLDNLLSEQACP